jgi:hypothetical protein
MRSVRCAALLFVAALPARPAAAQEGPFAAAVGWGGPLGAAVTAELIQGLQADIDEDGDRVKGRAGLLLQLQAGTGGGKLSVGVGARGRVESDDFKGTAAAGLKLSLAHTWHAPVGTASGLTYLGPEIDLSAMHVALSVGPLFRVGGQGGAAVLFSFGVGVRF